MTRKFGIILSSAFLILIVLLGFVTVILSDCFPVKRVTVKENVLAVSVNVYGNTDVDFILEDLQGIKATFFISEEFESAHSEKIKSIVKCGHDIGLLEDDFKGKTTREINDHLAERIESMAFLAGENCNLVRFQDNTYKAGHVKTIYSLGLVPVQWSADVRTARYSPGDIVLIDTESDIDTALKKLNNFHVKSINELLSDK